MDKLIAAAAVAGLLVTAACSADRTGSADGAPFFTPQDGGTTHAGYPRTNSATTVGDMFGNSVAAPGMSNKNGGSTTQSLGAQAPGAANTSGGGGGGAGVGGR
jgi:hypothetical protein